LVPTGCALDVFRLRRGVRVERRVLRLCVAGPEAHGVLAALRVPRVRKVERAPPELHRRHAARIPRAVPGEDGVHADEHAEEAVRPLRVVAPVLEVLGERVLADAVTGLDLELGLDAGARERTG